MRDEQRQILDMVNEGKITAQEAEQLLAALGDEGGQLPGSFPRPVIPAQTAPPFRRYWEIPVGVGVLVLAVSGLCLMWSTTISLFLLATLCLWTVFILAGAAVLVGLWSRSARWIHVRIREQDGNHIRISLPLPLNIVRWGMGIAHRFTDDDTAKNLEMADSLLSMVQYAPPGEPLMVEVDEPDGDHILVYIG
jgi:hypothetical protein